MFLHSNKHAKKNVPLSYTYSQAFHYLNNGRLLNSKKDFDAALKSLQQAYSYFVFHKNDLIEDYASTVYFMGCCYKEKGLNEKAEWHLKEAYKKYFLLACEADTPYHISLLLNVSIDLAQIYIAEGRHEDARKILIDTKKVSGNFFQKNQDIDVNFISWMSDICTLLGECTHSLQESLSYFIEANNLKPSAALGIRICILLIDLNKANQAYQYLSNFYHQDLESQLKADVCFHLARCCLKLEKYIEAYCYLEQAGDFYKSQSLNEILITFGLAITAYRLGSDNEGNERFKKFLNVFYSLTSASDIDIVNQSILDWCEKANFPDHFNLYKNPNLMTLCKLLAVIKNDAESQNEIRSKDIDLPSSFQFKAS